ncbi:HDOD domain-containing protein [Methylococcus sp. EFPC2]|uniref:HDOD domain-containing protein n=1 Tax=Methylococcus sp. EFPC2 TaxID=2812648 RepID=UPI00196808BD|nr:HDOD domain-containing protein [Methylococcus sp. EFPC2]QSA96050.1 HDOD domain-containing protein [Methylococcus sp. EFPC2]
MSLFSRIFGSKKSEDLEAPSGDAAAIEPVAQAVPSTLKPVPVTLEMLGQLFPIRNLGEEEVAAFATDRFSEVFGPGSVLFRRDVASESLFYLLEGTVLMELGDGKRYEVQARTAKARFPLCSARRYSATATALTDVQVLRVSPKLMSRHGGISSSQPAVVELLDESIPDEVRSIRLFQAFYEHYHGDELQLPTLPDVALKLRKAVESHMDIAELVRIIQIDPAISAKLVRVANSPLYLPTRPITTCQDAVVRLGVRATRSLVIGYTLKQIFRCKDPFINQLLRDEWKQSIYLSGLCYVLAAENGRFDQEEALLAGLLCDIGTVPLLYFAENFPRDYWTPEDITTILPWLRGPLGSYVLERWDFPTELVEIPLLAEEWFHDSGPELTLSDIVILSKLHACIGTARMNAVPAINSIPACGKLKDGALSPEHSLNVLHQARDKINQVLKLFDI